MFGPPELSLHLAPTTFFPLEIDIHSLKKEGLQPLSKTFELPDTSGLCNEISWATVKLGWHQSGIAAVIESSIPAAETFSPNDPEGDRVELFFDTRNRKESGFTTRFCHHFVFLPISFDGKTVAEITRLRAGEEHPLADPEWLLCETDLGRKSFTMRIFIHAEALYGYDPTSFDRLGFTYRIGSSRGALQHFTVVTKEFPPEQRPSLWSTLRLVK